MIVVIVSNKKIETSAHSWICYCCCRRVTACDRYHQGCMNNFTFGDEGMGYYETIAGGAGAGPHWHGRSGVHTHMTNTRITDPEILERRYPLVLHRFCLRPGSGGGGRWRGGDGVVREVEFLRPMTAAILSERRTTRPFGVCGGGDAQPGLNLLLKVRHCYCRCDMVDDCTKWLA